MEENKRKISFWEGMKRNNRAWKIWWKLCPGVFLSSLLSSIFQALSPYVTIWLSAQIINELAGNRNPERLFRFIIAQLLSALVLALVNGVLNRWNRYEQDLADRIDDRIYMNKMLSLDYADIDRQYTFDLYSQMMQNENWAGRGIRITISYFEKLVTAVIRIMGGIGLSASLFISQVPADSGRFIMLNHPFFLLVMVVAMIGAAVLSPVCANKGRQYWGRCAPAARQGNRCFGFYGFMHEDRKRALDLRMYRQQENICSLYMQRDNSFGPTAELAACAKGPMGLWHALSQSIQAALTGIVYLFVCLKAWAGAFGAGSVTQYVGAIMNIFSGISDLLETLGTIYINAGFLGESFEFLDIPNKMYQGSLTTEKRADRQYQIEFRNVSFQYPGTDVWALRHVSMKFQVGSRLAVAGRNGSGKTTFIKLLCRLYDPTEGQILLNGIDIRKYRYDDYINIFSVVFQDFQLFSMPLGQNIAGKTKYDRTKVIDCLKKAGFAERLETMPDGLNTCLYKELEKEGVEISGGEAQKIAIARALYKDAPFIILDEPTAALDPLAEAEIYENFNELVGDKTAIYISHRMSSCKFCDKIVVLEQGEIAETGNHEELMERQGSYYALYHAQAQYYA